MCKHIDFKIIAARNPAEELKAINAKHGCFCEVTEGKNGETLFDAFDVASWIAPDIEAVARKYALMDCPKKEDGISYMRKGEDPEDPVVVWSNGLTAAHINLVLAESEFEKK